MRSSRPVPSDIFPSKEEIGQHAAELQSRRSDPDQIEVRRLAEDQLLEKAARRALQPWAGWRWS